MNKSIKVIFCNIFCEYCSIVWLEKKIDINVC